MGSADPVHTHCFHDLELALQCSKIDGGAKTAQVVVVAHAFDFGLSAIQEEASPAVEGKCPDSE
jgi:hypothetical protein